MGREHILLDGNTGAEGDRRRLHAEQGLHGTIVVEQYGHFNRLVLNGTLWGTQFNDKFRRHYADDLGLIVPGCPWDIIAAAGANAVYNPPLDPLTYYHRTGPIGAMFRELRAQRRGRMQRRDRDTESRGRDGSGLRAAGTDDYLLRVRPRSQTAGGRQRQVLYLHIRRPQAQGQRSTSASANRERNWRRTRSGNTHSSS